MRRVLVAVDESEASERVAAFVGSFFDGVDADLLVISVARTAVPWAPVGVPYGGVAAWPTASGERVIQEAQAAADEEARRAVERTRVDDADGLVASGDPVAAILRAADEHDVDLVVVGSTHKGFLTRTLEGSVSEDLVRQRELPVLVVP